MCFCRSSLSLLLLESTNLHLLAMTFVQGPYPGFLNRGPGWGSNGIRDGVKRNTPRGRAWIHHCDSHARTWLSRLVPSRRGLDGLAGLPRAPSSGCFFEIIRVWEFHHCQQLPHMKLLLLIFFMNLTWIISKLECIHSSITLIYLDLPTDAEWFLKGVNSSSFKV